MPTIFLFFIIAGGLLSLIVFIRGLIQMPEYMNFIKIYRRNSYKGYLFFKMNDMYEKKYFLILAIAYTLLIIIIVSSGFLRPDLVSNLYTSTIFGWTIFVFMSIALIFIMMLTKKPKCLLTHDAIWYTDKDSKVQQHKWEDIRSITIQRTGKVIITNSGKIRCKISDKPKRSHITFFLSNKQYVTISDISSLPSRLESRISKYSSAPIKIYN